MLKQDVPFMKDNATIGLSSCIVVDVIYFYVYMFLSLCIVVYYRLVCVSKFSAGQTTP